MFRTFILRHPVFGPQSEKARFLNWVRVRITKAALAVDEWNWQLADLHFFLW